MSKTCDVRPFANQFVVVEIDGETGASTPIGRVRSQAECLNDAIKLTKAATNVAKATTQRIKAEMEVEKLKSKRK